MVRFCKNSWKKELKLIEGLMSLYPDFERFSIYDYFMYKKEHNIYEQYFSACHWIFMFCGYKMNTRIPQLEKFLKYATIYPTTIYGMWGYYKHKKNISQAWVCYQKYFNLK